MKSLWNAICVIAIANLLALGGVVGWLRSSDRINMDRVRELRVMLAKTITQQHADEEQAKAATEAEKKKSEADAKSRRVPLTASEQLAARLEATELDEQRLKGMRSEVDALQRTLREAQDKVKTERAALDADKAAFEAAKKSYAETTKNEQFQKTLAVLQSVKPAEARSILSELMGGAAAPAASSGATAPAASATAGTPSIPPTPNKGREQVVAYLDAMEAKSRTKVLTEFLKSDPKLAAELLEDLRQRGQVASAVGKNAP